MTTVKEAVTTKMEDGTVTVSIGGTEKEFPFQYSVIVENAAEGKPTFDSLCDFLLANGYERELQEPIKIEGQRGKASEPKSLSRALIYFHNARNQQEARASEIREQTDTAENVIATATASLAKLSTRKDTTPFQLKKAELIQQLGAATTQEQIDSIMEQMAALKPE